MKKNLIISCFLSSIFFTACKQKNETKPVYQPVQEYVFATGFLNWEKNYTISAQTDGTIQNLNIELGDTLQANQLLGRIENPTNFNNEKAAQEQYRIAQQNLQPNAPALEQIEKNILVLKENYTQEKLIADRYERLYKKESVSKLDWEQKQLKANTSLLQIEALQKQYNALKTTAAMQLIQAENNRNNSLVQQDYTRIQSFAKGVVIKKLKSTNDFVRKGEPLLIVGNNENATVVLYIDEKSIHKIQLNQAVFVQFNTYPSKIFNGKIVDIVPFFDEQQHSYICKAKLDSLPSKIFYNTPLEANILVGKKPKALLIPKAFLINNNEVILKEKNQKRKVQTGIISNEYVEIINGLDSNDILLSPKN